MPAKKKTIRKTVKGRRQSSSRTKAINVLRKLDAAGVKLIATPGVATRSTPPKTGSRLTAAALRDMRIKDVDFTAWGAWTLRF